MNLSLSALSKRILKDKYNSIIFEKGKDREVYLVGGYIRDIFRGISSTDRDYLINQDIDEFVRELNEIFHGTIVFFKKGTLRRIVLKNGITFDFSTPLGTLHEDLSKRDFTINSIAWSPKKGIIDPYNGLDDIKKRVIRCISSENLISDPLRIIRAYRFAAEFNGSIETKTRNALKILSKKLNTVASERITLEFFNLLNQNSSAKYLKMALTDRILNELFLLNYKELESNIRAIYNLEKKFFNRLPYNFKVILNRLFSQNITYKGLICLETLLKNDYKNKKLNMSTAIRKRIKLSHKGIEEIKKHKRNLERSLFDIFMKSNDASVDALILEGKIEFLKDYERFKKIWKNGILSSEEVIKASGIKTGPKLGKMILELKKAQFEGRVKTKNQAIRFVKEISESINNFTEGF
jgi:tRNA nucleotidyltransferase/poly(A) polymerase